MFFLIFFFLNFFVTINRELLVKLIKSLKIQNNVNFAKFRQITIRFRFIVNIKNEIKIYFKKNKKIMKSIRKLELIKIKVIPVEVRDNENRKCFSLSNK